MPHLVEVDVCHDQSRNKVPRWQHNEMMVSFLIWESAADNQELLIVQRGSLFVQNALSRNKLTSLEASDLFVEDVRLGSPNDVVPCFVQGHNVLDCEERLFFELGKESTHARWTFQCRFWRILQPTIGEELCDLFAVPLCSLGFPTKLPSSKPH